MLIYFLILIPAITCIAVRAARLRKHIEWIHTGGFLLTLVMSAAVAIQGQVDALSRFMVVIIAFVAAIAGCYSIGYIRQEFKAEQFPRFRLFYALFHLFV